MMRRAMWLLVVLSMTSLISVGGAWAKELTVVSALTQEAYDVLENRILPAFYEEYPDVKVNIVKTSWQEIGSRLQIMFMSGLPVDVIIRNNVSNKAMAEDGLVLPLDDFVKDWDGLEQIYPLVLEDGKIDGTLYSLPLYIETKGICYNKRLFAENGFDADNPPQTWEDLLEVARKGTKVVNDRVVVMGFEYYWNRIWSPFSQFLQMTGSYPIVRPEMPNWLAPEVLETIEFLKQVYDYSNPSGAAPIPLAGNTDGAFTQFRALMGRGVMYYVNVFERERVLEDLGLIVPRYDMNTEPMLTGGENAVAIGATSSDPALAWKLIEYLLEPEFNAELSMGRGLLTVRKDAMEYQLALNPGIAPWLETISYAQFNSAEIWGDPNQYFEPSLNRFIKQRDITINDVVEQMQAHALIDYFDYLAETGQ